MDWGAFRSCSWILLILLLWVPCTITPDRKKEGRGWRRERAQRGLGKYEPFGSPGPALPCDVLVTPPAVSCLFLWCSLHPHSSSIKPGPVRSVTNGTTMPVSMEDMYRANLRGYGTAPLRVTQEKGAIKDHGALLKQVAKVGNTVVVTGFGRAVGRRLRDPGLTELDVNWKNKNYNSKESNLQYKYHISRLSKVYMAPAAVDNLPPYTVTTRPPFYTSPDELEPGVVGRRAREREEAWDRDCVLYHALGAEDRIDGARGDKKVPRTRPRSAEPRRSSRMEATVTDTAAMKATGKRRPRSAGLARTEISRGTRRNQEEHALSFPTHNLQPSMDPLVNRKKRAQKKDEKQSSLTKKATAEDELLRAIETYDPNDKHIERVGAFLDMLDEFDRSTRRRLLQEICHHSDSHMLLHQYHGTE